MFSHKHPAGEQAGSSSLSHHWRIFLLAACVTVSAVCALWFGLSNFDLLVRTALAQTAMLAEPVTNPFKCNTSGTSVTLSWGSVTGASVYALRFDDPTNNTSKCADGWYCGSPDYLNDTYVKTSITRTVVPGRTYTWWVHAKKWGTWAGLSTAKKETFSCGTNFPNNYAPIGFFDGTSNGVLTGWTLDPDVSSLSINVAIYMDGPKGVGQKIATVKADYPRPDVNTVHNVLGNHGFAWVIPNQYTGSHTWYIYGVDASNGDQQVHLTNSPRSYAQAPLPKPEMLPYTCSRDNTSVTLSWKNVTGADAYALRIDDSTNNTNSCTDGWYCANSQDYLSDTYTGLSITRSVTPGRQYSWWVHAKKANTWDRLSDSTKVNFSCGTNAESPIGFFDSAQNGVLSGWALDKDVPSRSIDVAIYMDGPKGVGQNVATVNANILRTDVNDDQQVTGNHGFAWTMPSQYTGTHTWHTYGVEVSDPRILASLSNSPKTYTAPVVGTYGKTKFGIIYELWHCDGIYDGYLWDVSKALVGDQPWVPIPNFSWWTEPAPGYYCYENGPPDWPNWDAVIRGHAEMLKAAGVDFIILDISNWASTGKFDSKRAIMDPLQRLLQIWKSVDGAPKIVQWTPLTAGGNMFDFVQDELDRPEYQDLRFIYEDNPLALVVSNGDLGGYPIDPSAYATSSEKYTMRQMWAMKALNPGMPAEAWSIFEPCQASFVPSNGTDPCNQGVTYKGGIPGNGVEQVAVATSYQISYATNNDDVPKLKGRTFVQQFKTAFDNPTAPIVIIDAWNEWIGQRLCLPQPGQPYVTNCGPEGDHWQNGMKVYVDSYDYERSRDIEPSKKAPYDFYYQLMKTCISKFRKGEMCKVTDVPYSAPPVVSTSPQVPQGHLDGADCSAISGWAQDLDVPTQTIEVSIYADSVPIARVPANGFRQDLCDELGSCNHAYGFAVPASLKNGVPHVIQAFGRDNANGSLTELSRSPRTIQCGGVASIGGWSQNLASAFSALAHVLQDLARVLQLA